MEQNSSSNVTAKIISSTELLKFSWQIFKNNWKIFVGLAILPQVLIVINDFFGVLTTEGSLLGLILIPITIVLFVSSCLLTIVQQVATVDLIRKAETVGTSSVTLLDQYKLGFGYFWSILFLAMVQVFVGLGSVTLFIIPLIIVGLYISFTNFAMVLDNKRGFDALAESFSLVWGRWLPVLGRFLVFGLVSIGIVIVFSIPFLIIRAILHLEPNSSGLDLLDSVSGLFISLIMPLGVIYSYKLYGDLKSTRLSDVPVAKFKKWLVGLFVFGIVAVVLGIIAAISFLTIPSSARDSFLEEFKEEYTGDMKWSKDYRVYYPR